MNGTKFTHGFLLFESKKSFYRMNHFITVTSNLYLYGGRVSVPIREKSPLKEIAPNPHTKNIILKLILKWESISSTSPSSPLGAKPLVFLQHVLVDYFSMLFSHVFSQIRETFELSTVFLIIYSAIIIFKLDNLCHKISLLCKLIKFVLHSYSKLNLFKSDNTT